MFSHLSLLPLKRQTAGSLVWNSQAAVSCRKIPLGFCIELYIQFVWDGDVGFSY
jgi:hypothetical protein